MQSFSLPVILYPRGICYSSAVLSSAVTLIIQVAILTGKSQVRKQSWSITPSGLQFLISAFEMILLHLWARDWINNEASGDTQCPIQPEITFKCLCSSAESQWHIDICCKILFFKPVKNGYAFFSAVGPSYWISNLHIIVAGHKLKSSESTVWFSG